MSFAEYKPKARRTRRLRVVLLAPGGDGVSPRPGQDSIISGLQRQLGSNTGQRFEARTVSVFRGREEGNYGKQWQAASLELSGDGYNQARQLVIICLPLDEGTCPRVLRHGPTPYMRCASGYDLLAGFQVRNLLRQSSALPSQSNILPGDVHQLPLGKAAHELRAEELQRRRRPCHQEVVRSLHAQVVRETLSGDFVVGSEDVVDLLDNVLHVGHVMILHNVFHTDDFAVLATVQSFGCQISANTVLTTESING